MVSEVFNVTTLRALELFKPLSDEQLEHLRPAINVRIASVGEVIMIEGEPGDELWVLLVGECKIIGNYKTPDEHIVDVVTPIDIMGEMALLTGGKRTATVVVTEPSRFLTLTARGLEDVLMEQPSVCYTLLKHAYRRMAEIRKQLAACTRGKATR